MRRFMLLLVTDVDFVDGPNVSDEIAHGFEQHLAEEVQRTAAQLSLRTIRGLKVMKTQVTEIKGLVSL
jgi:hypothetical protein